MSDYKLEIKGGIDLMDYSTISDYIQIVNGEDNLVINMENNTSDEAKLVCNILKKNNFEVMMKKGDETNGKYHIKALKNGWS